VHYLENKVLDIVDAPCNHDVDSSSSLRVQI